MVIALPCLQLGVDSEDAEEEAVEGERGKGKQDSVELEQEKVQLKSFQKSFNVRVRCRI